MTITINYLITKKDREKKKQKQHQEFFASQEKKSNCTKIYIKMSINVQMYKS